MTFSDPQAGWYPDPQTGPETLRWWDGSQWTKHTAPAADPASGPGGPGSHETGSPGPYGPAGQGQWGRPAGGYPGGWGGGSMGRGPWGGGPWGRGRWSGAGGPPAGTFGQRNRLSLTAMGVAAVYMLLALSTGIVLFGIFPIFMSVRAAQRREAFAPFAIAASVLTIIVALAVGAHRGTHY